MSGKITLEELREFRREFRPAMTEPRGFWIYQFEAEDKGDKQVFDFRLMQFDSKKEAELIQGISMSQQDISRKDEWSLNQVKGYPRLPEMTFETAKDAEEKILDLINGEADEAMTEEQFKKQSDIPFDDIESEEPLNYGQGDTQ